MNRQRLDPHLSRLIAEEFGDEAPAGELFQEFLSAGGSDRTFAARLVGMASGRDGRPSWPLRRAATLMLEAHLHFAPADDPGAFEHVLREIAQDPASGLTFPPGSSVLAEGYSTNEPRGFVDELRRRLARHSRLFGKLEGPETTPGALEDFLAIARQECRLTLARYLFRPSEVARRILEQVRISHGLDSPLDPEIVEEGEDYLRDWPAYEWEILRELLAHRSVLWAGDATSRRINSLVEYPLGTVVLVVKPPGSGLEIEIKRAGRRGDRPLSVRFDRDGLRVPPPHRLDGGSMGSNLRAEAAGAARFGRLYHRINGQRAPISRSLAHRTIHEIPGDDGPVLLLDYFTDPETFGEGFGAMRRAMSWSVRTFREEWKSDPLEMPGDLGLTVEFLSQVAPTQAHLGGSSSFRLELLGAYLGDEGPEAYLQRGLGIEPTPAESRRLAETLLDEILGEVATVEVAYRKQSQFVGDVLSEPANRRRADAIFLELAAEIGRFWGTLFGLKGYSDGESFVGRNVGLKSAWEGGRWLVRIIFMDHDLLNVPRERFSLHETLRGGRRDAARILGRPEDDREGALDWLAMIYRVDPDTAALGRSILLLRATEASRRARRALVDDPEVSASFTPECLRDALEGERAAIEYLHRRREGDGRKAAIDAVAGSLTAHGTPGASAESNLSAIRDFAEFLEENAAMLGVELSLDS